MLFFVMDCGMLWLDIHFLNIHRGEPRTFETLRGLEFRGPINPSEQERMRAWMASQANFAFFLELVLASSRSGMKVIWCWRCFAGSNGPAELIQAHPKRSQSKIWGTVAIASHRESLATMISNSCGFPPPDFWMLLGFSHRL